MVGSDESVSVQNKFMVYNFGCKDFTDDIGDLFQSMNLQSLWGCLQEPSVSKQIAGMDLKKNTCGQP
eukprot:13709376-Ditylum_brightwellii.AAC.1